MMHILYLVLGLIALVCVAAGVWRYVAYFNRRKQDDLVRRRHDYILDAYKMYGGSDAELNGDTFKREIVEKIEAQPEFTHKDYAYILEAIAAAEVRVIATGIKSELAAAQPADAFAQIRSRIKLLLLLQHLPQAVVDTVDIDVADMYRVLRNQLHEVVFRSLADGLRTGSDDSYKTLRTFVLSVHWSDNRVYRSRINDHNGSFLFDVRPTQWGACEALGLIDDAANTVWNASVTTFVRTPVISDFVGLAGRSSYANGVFLSEVADILVAKPDPMAAKIALAHCANNSQLSQEIGSLRERLAMMVAEFHKTPVPSK